MSDTLSSPDLETAAITTEGKLTGSAARTRKRLSRPWASVASILIAVLWTIPTLGLFISSFRPRDQILTSGWWEFFLNPEVTGENYVDVLASGTTQLTMLESFVNSIAITIPATIVPLMIASMAAYSFAWIDFKDATSCSSSSSRCRSCPSRWPWCRC